MAPPAAWIASLPHHSTPGLHPLHSEWSDLPVKRFPKADQDVSAEHNWFLDGYVYRDPDMNFDQASFAQQDWNNLNTGFDRAVQSRFLNYPIQYTSFNYLAELSCFAGDIETPGCIDSLFDC